jgi:2-polyprenyl-6-hydroxyphenyl methylase/3-demethylubiquinone-9 3-methyltransferase
MNTDWRRPARAVADRGRALGRRVGLLPYQPERWTTDRWDAAYDSPSLGYYGGIEELARYSIVVGYVGWFGASRPGRPPRLLDLGCGVGLLRERLEGVELSEYVGVDLSDVAIRAAGARGHPRSRFLAGDVFALDLGRFDVVVLNEVLYYAADARGLLKGLRDILEPEGVLVVSMWRHPGDRFLWRIIDDEFPIVDRVEARNSANAVNRRGWALAYCSARGSAPAQGR